MKNGDNTQYHVEDAFECRYLNVFKLLTVRQCEIAIAEIKYNCDFIERDLADRGKRDEDWSYGARFALSDYQHKARMVALRMAELSNAVAEKKDWIVNRSAMFYKAAQEILEPDVFKRITARVDLQMNARKEGKA